MGFFSKLFGEKPSGNIHQNTSSAERQVFGGELDPEAAANMKETEERFMNAGRTEAEIAADKAGVDAWNETQKEAQAARDADQAKADARIAELRSLDSDIGIGDDAAVGEDAGVLNMRDFDASSKVVDTRASEEDTADNAVDERAPSEAPAEAELEEAA